MTISITYLEDLSRVRLSLSDMVDGTVLVERSLNQLLWETVRGGSALPIQSGIGQIDDYEFTPDVINYYRVTSVSPGAGLILPGAAGSYASTPDHIRLDIAGDLEVRADITPDVWASGAAQYITAKYTTTGDQRSYRLLILANGTVQLGWTTLGTAASVLTASSTEAVPAGNGERISIRAALDVNNGSGGRTVNFWTGSSIDGPWTPLGDAVTTSGVTSIFVGTGILEAGTAAVGTVEPFAGAIHELRVYDGLSEDTYLQGLKLNSTTNTYASTPDNAALDITGDIDLRAEVLIADWTPATIYGLVTKYAVTANQRSYQLQLDTNGTLVFQWSTAGTATLSAVSTVPVPGHAGVPLSVRATLDVDNGASGRTVTFYTSPDFTTWTQLGSAVTTAGVTSIFAGTGDLAVGARIQNFANGMTGRILRAEVRNGINGTAVANPDFRDPGNGWVDGDNSATAGRADAAGRTWTLSGEAMITGVGLVADPDFAAEPSGTTSFTDDAGRTWTLQGDAQIAGDAEFAQILPLFGSDPWLKSIKYPFLNRPIDCPNFGDIVRAFRGGIFEIKGRSVPVAVTDLMGSRAFTLTVLTRTLEESRNMDLILSANQIMFLQIPKENPDECDGRVLGIPGGYIAILGVNQPRGLMGSPLQRWELSCRIVAKPGPDVVGTTLTWGTVYNLYGSWEQLINANPTWIDLFETVGSPDDLVVL